MNYNRKMVSQRIKKAAGKFPAANIKYLKAMVMC